MSNPVGPARPLRFVLRTDPPLKTYFVASLYTLCGAILLVFALRGGWKLGFAIFAGALILFGALLAVVAVLVHNMLQTTILVGTDELTLVNPGRKRVLRWTDIEEVGTAGPRLFFARPNARRTIVLFNPKQTDSGLFNEMVSAIQRRMDDSRGYRWLAD